MPRYNLSWAKIRINYQCKDALSTFCSQSLLIVSLCTLLGMLLSTNRRIFHLTKQGICSQLRGRGLFFQKKNILSGKSLKHIVMLLPFQVGCSKSASKARPLFGGYSLLLLFGDTLKRTFNAFALSGRDCSNTWDPGCRYACPGLRAPLAFQAALVSRVLLVVIGRYLL